MSLVLQRSSRNENSRKEHEKGNVHEQSLHAHGVSLPNKALWLTLAACAVLYSPSLFWSLGLDQNIFAEIGSLLLRGKHPYLDVWDVKPPNVFYTYAFFEWIAGEREFAVRLADFVATMAACAAMFIGVRRRVANHVAREPHLRWSPVVASVLLALTLLSLGLSDTAQTESFALSLVLIAPFLAYNEGHAGKWLAGVAIAVAAFFKTTNAIFLLPLVLELWLLRGQAKAKSRATLEVLAGFVCWSLVQFAVLAMEGSLGEYLRITAAVMRVHPQEVSSLRFVDLLRALWVSVDLWSVLAVAALVVVILRRDRGLLRALRLPLLYLASGLVAVYVQNKGWGYHYVVTHPGLISTCGVAAVYLTAQIARTSKPFAIAFAAVVVAATLFLTPSAHRRVTNVRSAMLSLSDHRSYVASLGSEQSLYYPECTETLAQYLQQKTSTNEKIFIFGEEPGALWRSSREPATRYIYSLLFTSGVIQERELSAIGDKLARVRPALIVIERFDTLGFRGRPETSESIVASDTAYASLRAVIASRYALADTVCGKFIVYRRRS